MPEIDGKQQLLLTLRDADDGRWSVISDLAHTSEPDLRRILRPHAELELGNDEESLVARSKRKRLDAALGLLTQLEVGYEIGVITIDDQAPASIPHAKSLKTLFESEAFLRYVNAYLYFGIRFLAGRMHSAPPPQRDSNQQLFSLVPPPALECRYKIAESAFTELIRSSTAVDPALKPPDDLIPQVMALSFLDGFVNKVTEDVEDPLSEPELLELWLRGLCGGIAENKETRFRLIRSGFDAWGLGRRDFYLSLHGVTPDSLARREIKKQDLRPPGGWVVTNPLASRFALLEVYWIARSLRADVLPNGSISYARTNWLSLLRFRTGLEGGTDVEGKLRELRKTEEVLRSVFDFVCDLVQNATEVSKQEERGTYEPESFNHYRPPETVNWRVVFDEELNEIEKERGLREFKSEPLTADWLTGVPSAAVTSARPGSGDNLPASQLPDHSTDPKFSDWMERLRRDKPIYNLVGLCFSGGGIRSATFNLGILQGLQELDMLRKIDFISTVSGGGYTGSWLVANVLRTRHWLGRLTSWDDSIAHLRRYSNYLAPRLGAFSADTWTMWTSWARNAFLIQLTGLVWLWFTLLLARLLKDGFVHFRGGGYLAAILMFIILVVLSYNLSGNRPISGNATGAQAGSTGLRSRLRELMLWLLSGSGIWWGAVLPAWVASFALASRLWTIATSMKDPTVVFACRGQCILQIVLCRTSYVITLLRFLVRPIGWPSACVLWVALGAIAFFTLSRLGKESTIRQSGIGGRIRWRIWHAFWMSLLCTGILLLELRSIQWLFIQWSEVPDEHVWYAYIFGPPLVLAAHTIAVVLFIGFCGRHSKEAIREWWSRFGAALARVAVAYLGLTVAAIFGPYWTLYLLNLPRGKWGSIITWLATVVAGLLAGKSSKTSGNGQRSTSRRLEFVAKVGGFAFIVGAILFASTALYLILGHIAAPDQKWRHYSDYRSYLQMLSHVSGSWERVSRKNLIWCRQYPHWYVVWIAIVVCAVLGALFSRFFEINIFGLNQFYRFRLVRCYLGATRWAPGFRRPQPFTNFDGNDDMRLSEVLGDRAKDTAFRGPFPIFNCALNLAGSSDLALHTRHSASFSLTPKFCGADRRLVGYSRTEDFANGVMLGQAVAVSGAAASPNMGFNTSPLVAFLLTMFNVRLGWWFPNPGQKAWHKPGLSFSLYYLLCELFGVADENRRFVNVSDGGHFENLGVYELVRRRCKVIIVCDAECDEFLQFGSLGNVVRMCETDFGAKIELNVSSIRQQKDGLSLAHCSVGTITYSNGSIGHIIYLKASISGDEDVGIAQYRSVHPSFPHETTADQFFSEDQFESYRRLGLHIIRESFQGCEPGDHPVTIAERLADVLAPTGCSSEAFLKHTTTLDGIWERFRNALVLQPFFKELIRDTLVENPVQDNQPTDAETLIGLELIQLMENVFLDLRLDEFWSHPDNRGWAILFMRWARSPRFRAIWNRTRRTFGIRFEYFCEARLGLRRDRPIVRV